MKAFFILLVILELVSAFRLPPSYDSSQLQSRDVLVTTFELGPGFDASFDVVRRDELEPQIEGLLYRRGEFKGKRVPNRQTERTDRPEAHHDTPSPAPAQIPPPPPGPAPRPPTLPAAAQAHIGKITNPASGQTSPRLPAGRQQPLGAAAPNANPAPQPAVAGPSTANRQAVPGTAGQGSSTANQSPELLGGEYEMMEYPGGRVTQADQHTWDAADDAHLAPFRQGTILSQKAREIHAGFKDPDTRAKAIDGACQAAAGLCQVGATATYFSGHPLPAYGFLAGQGFAVAARGFGDTYWSGQKATDTKKKQAKAQAAAAAAAAAAATATATTSSGPAAATNRQAMRKRVLELAYLNHALFLEDI